MPTETARRSTMLEFSIWRHTNLRSVLLLMSLSILSIYLGYRFQLSSYKKDSAEGLTAFMWLVDLLGWSAVFHHTVNKFPRTEMGLVVIALSGALAVLTLALTMAIPVNALAEIHAGYGSNDLTQAKLGLVFLGLAHLGLIASLFRRALIFKPFELPTTNQLA